MDFAKPLEESESLVSTSGIRTLPLHHFVAGAVGLRKQQQSQSSSDDEKAAAAAAAANDEDAAAATTANDDDAAAASASSSKSASAAGNEKKNVLRVVVDDDEIDRMVIRAANRAAADMLLGPLPTECPLVAVEPSTATTATQQQQQEPQPERRGDRFSWTAAVTTASNGSDDDRTVDCALYPERMRPLQHETIQSGDLVVIMESFDKLDFVYAKRGDVFNNKNGQFHHDDFIDKLGYGSKIRSRNHRGYGFCYLLKPTPELWARSLNHRTQIVHELDQSQIVFQLHLKPNMVVVESGTGSGAMSHSCTFLTSFCWAFGVFASFTQ